MTAIGARNRRKATVKIREKVKYNKYLLFLKIRYPQSENPQSAKIQESAIRFFL